MAMHRLATALVSWCDWPFVAVCLHPCAAVFSPQTLQHFLHPLPLMTSGTRTARCARWCWRTRAARTATPADHTSTAGMPSRPATERRAAEREHMHHQEAGTLFLSLCTCRFCSALCDTRIQRGQQGLKNRRQLPAGVTDTACGRRQLVAAACCIPLRAFITRLRPLSLHNSPLCSTLSSHQARSRVSTCLLLLSAPPKAPTMARSRVSTCLLLLVGLLIASFGQAAQDGHHMARSECRPTECSSAAPHPADHCCTDPPPPLRRLLLCSAAPAAGHRRQAGGRPPASWCARCHQPCQGTGQPGTGQPGPGQGARRCRCTRRCACLPPASYHACRTASGGHKNVQGRIRQLRHVFFAVQVVKEVPGSTDGTRGRQSDGDQGNMITLPTGAQGSRFGSLCCALCSCAHFRKRLLAPLSHRRVLCCLCPALPSP